MSHPKRFCWGVLLLSLSISNLLGSVLSSQLKAYWPLDGDAADHAPGGQILDDGTWANTAQYSATAKFGLSGQFGGINSIAVPNSQDLLMSGGPSTVSLWCISFGWTTSWQTLFSKGNYIKLSRYGSDPNLLYFTNWPGGVYGGAVNDSSWHHVAAVSDPATGVYLYIDGVYVGSGGLPSVEDNRPLTIGGNSDYAGLEWEGNLDDVALFSGALSSFQVAAIHRFGIDHNYTMAEVVQIMDAHAAGEGGAAAIGSETWSYRSADTGSGSFVQMAADGSGVDVALTPTIASFDYAETPLIQTGGSATLTWYIESPYDSVTINQGIGDVTHLTDAEGNGSITVSPAQTTRYTLFASNSSGTSQRSVDVYVGSNPNLPRINEFLADNNSESLLDEDGDSVDWIEIYNPGPESINLDGYHLTDDPLLPNKWSFPGVNLPANGYLVVYASGKDRRNRGQPLHTNFSLNSGGEYLALTLTLPGGAIAAQSEFSPSYPPQKAGYSYGLDADGSTLGYFTTATPGGANGDTKLGFVADTSFDFDRGVYSAAFNLTISSLTTGVKIRYTTDGSTPTESHGTLYSGPIPITKTTCIRAMAYKTGYFPTDVDTQTYLFPGDIKNQYADGVAPAGWPAAGASVNNQEMDYGMDPDVTSRYSDAEIVKALTTIPSISLVTDQPNLTDATTGIYVNARRRGRAWERPGSFEIIDPTGRNISKQANCGIRMRGGFSRYSDNPKHSFRLFFRSEYGDSKLNYPLFEGEGVDAFDKVDLRTAQNYSWSYRGDNNNTFLREVLARDLQAAIDDHPYTRSRYYHLYLNGVYWGLFMTQERAEARHGASYLGGDSDDYDTIKSGGKANGYLTEATDGTMVAGASAWSSLFTRSRELYANPSLSSFMDVQGLNPDGSVNSAASRLLDVDNLIDYMLVYGYTGHYDGPISAYLQTGSNNWYGIRNRLSNEHGFQFFMHDGEHTLGGPSKDWAEVNDRINSTTGDHHRDYYPRSNPVFIHRDLVPTEEYQLRFADRAHRLLFNGGIFSPSGTLNIMEKRRLTVRETIIAESARWGDAITSDPRDYENWVGAVNFVTDVINGRREVFLDQLRLAGLYPGLAAPVYARHGGQIPMGSRLRINCPSDATQLYYMYGSGDSSPDDWGDDLDPRDLGGAPKAAAQVIQIPGTGLSLNDMVYVPEGSSWSYLDDGSDQGIAWRMPEFDDSSWGFGPAQLGYGDGDEATLINGGPSGARIPTTYFRKQIHIPSPEYHRAMQIRITYDDAYAIYVNGAEVARHAGLPAHAQYDQYATNSVSNNAVDVFEIPTTAFKPGINTIAVEMHQRLPTSSDVSFDLRLIGLADRSGSTVSLELPETINGPTWVKSRTYNAATGEWSALNEAYFTLASPVASGQVVITEVHYNPADPTAAELAIDPTFESNDFEFIEIMNISNAVLDLGDAAFVKIAVGSDLDGVEYTFPSGTQILPGERLVIVANADAFVLRYPNVPIAGDYSSRLGNSGEWITLVDREGAVIQSFRYNDIAPWPLEADGLGHSLVLNDPYAGLDPANPASWSSSMTFGGSPGIEDEFYQIWIRSKMPAIAHGTASMLKESDPDADGWENLLEMGLGGDPDSSRWSEGQALAPVMAIGDSGVAGDTQSYLQLEFRRLASMPGYRAVAEFSSDMVTWDEGVLLQDLGPNGDGTETVIYRDVLPDDGSKRFVRIRVEAAAP